MVKRSPIKRKRSAPRRGRVRDPKYLAWIRTQPCIVCMVAVFPVQDGPSEAAHVGDRGLGQKCSDIEAVPLCSWHHRIGFEAHHRMGRTFWEFHGLDREAVIYDLAVRYRSGQA